MSDCSNSANSQLKALQARLDRVDDDLIAHYAGISQLVTNLSLNPATALSVVESQLAYNFSSAGQRALKSLLGKIPGYDQFKQLQLLDAAALIDGMGSKLAALAEQMIETAEAELATVVDAKIEAELARALAIVNGVDVGLQQLQASLDLAKTLSVDAGGKEAVALAETALSEAIAIAAEPAIQELQAVYDQAVEVVKKVNTAVAAVSGFMQTITDIASCQTRSSVISA